MTTKMSPWELAKKEGKTVIRKVMGPFVGVYYPYRKSGDLYVVGPEGPNRVFHCCQACDADFPIADFIEHVNRHNRQTKKYPDLIIDSVLVGPETHLPTLAHEEGQGKGVAHETD